MQKIDAEQEKMLVKTARHEPEAFRELYRLYFPRIYAYVAGRMNRREDAEDIVADVFLRVAEAFEGFEYRGAGSFTAWLFRIARNHVSQFYRRHPVSREPYLFDQLPEIYSLEPSPDETVAQQESADHLRSLITTLSPRRREIITLKFYGGLRNREIAEVLKLDERTVASHLCRALADLQRKYQSEKDTLP